MRRCPPRVLPDCEYGQAQTPSLAKPYTQSPDLLLKGRVYAGRIVALRKNIKCGRLGAKLLRAVIPCRWTMQTMSTMKSTHAFGAYCCLEVLRAAEQIMLVEMCMDEPHPRYVWRVSTKSESIYTTFIESWVYDEVTTILHYHLCHYCWDSTAIHATYFRHWLSDHSSSDPQSNSVRSLPL